MTITPGPWRLKFEPPGNNVDHSDFPYAHLCAGDDLWDEISNSGFHLYGIINKDDAQVMITGPELVMAIKLLHDRCIEARPSYDSLEMQQARAAYLRATGHHIADRQS